MCEVWGGVGMFDTLTGDVTGSPAGSRCLPRGWRIASLCSSLGPTMALARSLGPLPGSPPGSSWRKARRLFLKKQRCFPKGWIHALKNLTKNFISKLNLSVCLLHILFPLLCLILSPLHLVLSSPLSLPVFSPQLSLPLFQFL